MKRKALAKYILAVKQSLEDTHCAKDRPIYGLYLSELAVMLAKLTNDDHIEEDAARYERLLGNTWISDEQAARRMGLIWNDIKNQLLSSP